MVNKLSDEAMRTVATSVPRRVKKFIDEETKRTGESTSEYLRRFLKALYEIRACVNKMEENKPSNP
jgi:negative regulator of replication initiation